MRLAIISHKVCRKADDSPSGFATDGGFPLQIGAISELFDKTEVVVPCDEIRKTAGLTPLVGKEMRICELSVPCGNGLKRKLAMPFWFLRNGKIIWRKIKAADAVHVPIPGDVGTIGFIFALLQKKPLFVRHCGNWLVERTTAEKFWKWLIEKCAGGRNLMLATGGARTSPSRKNPNVKWIFSTSLRQKEIAAAKPRELPADGKIKLIVACRQEPRKGTNILIESLPLILKKFPNAALDVAGDGSLLDELKKQAKILCI
jgi:glycosyltransferase involved in cell wall biosynthesis